jgi:CRP-like cAMP-binding protein
MRPILARGCADVPGKLWFVASGGVDLADNGPRMPYLVHLGYVLMLGGFLARDILVLRSLLVCAQVIVAVYAVSVAVPSIGAWNALFAFINAVWVALILRERREVRIDGDLQEIYRTRFAAMSPREFLRWWQLGRPALLHGGSLTRDGVHPSALYFILEGEVAVTRGGHAVTELPAGFFVAEMSLITGRPANADADAAGDVRVQQWERGTLDALRTRDLAMWTKVQSALGADLVDKIRRLDADRNDTVLAMP